MKRMILVVLAVVILLAGCAIVPTGYGRYGVVLYVPPTYVPPAYGYYGGYYGYGYGGYSRYPYGYGGYYGGWGPRWIPGYVLRVCEDRSTGRVCYDTWEPAH